MNTKREKPDFSSMSGPELLAAYNGMVAELGQPLYRETKRFSSHPAGVRRCEAMFRVLTDGVPTPAPRTLRMKKKAEKSEENTDAAEQAEKEPETAPEGTAGSASGEAETSGGAEKQESDVAKKKVKKAAKKSAAKKAPAATGIVAEFHQRADSNRARLLLALYAKKNRQVSKAELAKATYAGTAKPENPEAAVNMVLVGLEIAMKKHRLPYTIVRERKDGESTIGLHAK